MKSENLGFEPRGVWFRVTVEPSDLTETAVDTAQDIDLLNYAAGDLVEGAAMRSEGLSDASDSGFNDVLARFGDDGDNDRFVADQQVASNNGSPVSEAGPPAALSHVYTSSGKIRARFTPAGGKALANIDTGSVSFLIKRFNIHEV